MSFPVQAFKQIGADAKTGWGIIIGLQTTEPGLETEILRTSGKTPFPAQNPATSAAIVRATLPPGQTEFSDKIPFTSTYYWYAARHVRDTYDDTTETAWAGALPVDLQDFNQVGTAVRMEGRRRTDSIWQTDGVLKADVGVVDSGTILVTDSTGGASAITKTLRIPFAEFMPRDDADQWLVNLTYLQPNVANIQIDFAGSVPLPRGVTVNGFDFRSYRNSSDDTAQATFYQVDDTPSQTDLVTLAHDTSGWNTLTSTSFSQLVGSEQYFINVSLTGDTVAANARLLWCDITYTVPSYDKSY